MPRPSLHVSLRGRPDRGQGSWRRALWPCLLVVGALAGGCGADSSAQGPVGSDVYQRALERARAVGLSPPERPKRFIVGDYVQGPDDDPYPPDSIPVAPQTLDAALETLRLLGINTVEVKLFGPQKPRIDQRARELGFIGFRRAVSWPGGIFSWDPNVRPAEVEKWVRTQAQQSTTLWGMPPSRVLYFQLADEPGWYFPSVFEELRRAPSGFATFRAYLRRHGFTPGDFGASTWAGVSPLAQGGARTLPQRRLFYWTVRFFADSADEGLARYTRSLRRHFSPRMLTASNWNNRVSVSYYRSPGRKFANNTNTGLDAAMGSLHWPDLARAGGTTTMWSEDWFKDRDAQTWGVYADALRAAARYGTGSFGGYVVGRELGDIPAGGKYKALTLIAHGAKVIEWYAFGPEEKFAENGYSNNEAAYREIADANRMIAAGEDLLYPGRPPQPQVALLVSRSTQLWHGTPQTWPGDTRPPRFERELYGLHHALTHAHYPVDFLDEQAVSAGELRSRGYRVLYVTAPNVELAAQRRIREWVAAGGVIAFAPGAAAADQYDSASGELGALRGRPRGNGVTTRRVGRGYAVSYGSWPGNSYLASADDTTGGLPSGWSADVRRAAVRPARLAHVVAPVSANREVVEVDRLDSRAGTAVVLLNWTGSPISSLEVRVKGAAGMRSATSVVSGGASITRSGTDAVVRLPLRDVDVLKLRR